MKPKAHSATINMSLNTRVFWGLVAIITASLFLYIYSVNITVRTVAKLEEARRELALKSAQIGELEFEYIELTNKIDLSKATEMGFAPASPKAFVSRRTSVALVPSASFDR